MAIHKVCEHHECEDYRRGYRAGHVNGYENWNDAKTLVGAIQGSPTFILGYMTGLTAGIEARRYMASHAN